VWDSGVSVALATDCNPGTANVESMPFVISLAALNMGLTVDEAVWAATRGGARALGFDDRGCLVPGAIGDLVVLDAPTHLHLAYRPAADIVAAVVKRGGIL
jgi:imidazolonepropionase